MSQNDLKHNNAPSSEEDDDETSDSEDEETSDSSSYDISESDYIAKPKQEPEKALTAPPQYANKSIYTHLSSADSEESSSDSDTDLLPKKSAVVRSNIKPAPAKMISKRLPAKKISTRLPAKKISTRLPANRKRPRLTPAAIEREAKRAKQNTANGDYKKASVAASQPALDLSSSGFVDFYLQPKESTVVHLDVKSPPAKMISTPPTAKSKLPPPAPAPIEKEAKKAKQQNTVNGNLEKASVASSQYAPEGPELSSSGDDFTDTDNDSDSLPRTSAVANPNVNPISSKPMENLESKPFKSSRLFQRVWSLDNEIALLEGMISYKNKRHCVNPMADMGAFHVFIKKSLHVSVSKSQLNEKVRRLKQKYLNNASMCRSFFKNGHEQKAYELSDLIWGRGTESKMKNFGQKNGNSKGNGCSTSTSGAASLLNLNDAIDKNRAIDKDGLIDKDAVKMNVEKSMDVSRFVQYGVRNVSMVSSEEIVKAGLELVDGSKRAELEGKWKKLKELELELYVQRMELLKEQALAVLEAVRSSGN